MSAIKMPQDSRGYPVPILGVEVSQGIGYTTTERVALSDATREVVTLYATTACWIRFGDNTVDATKPGAADYTNHLSFFLPATTFFDVKVPEGATHVAVVQDSAGGSLHILERE